MTSNLDSGVFHIALTPFRSDDTVDVESIHRVAEMCRTSGCAGIVPLGIMGEAHKLTEAERDTVVRAYIEGADGTPIVAGATGQSVVQTVERCERAASLGAAAVMIAPPSGPYSQDLLVDYFTSVAERVSVPIVVQDEPVTTGVKLGGGFFTGVSQIPGIMGVKVEEVPSPRKMSVIQEADTSGRLRLFGGLGGVSFIEELSRGAHGIYTGFGFPDILVKIQTAWDGGRHQEARDIYRDYLPLIRFEAQMGVGAVGIRKALFAERGLIADATPRPPFSAMDRTTLDELRDVLAYVGIAEEGAA